MRLSAAFEVTPPAADFPGALTASAANYGEAVLAQPGYRGGVRSLGSFLLQGVSAEIPAHAVGDLQSPASHQGHTAEGSSCACTDGLAKSSQQLLSAERRGRELEAKHLEAKRSSADLAVQGPVVTFEAARDTYDKVLKDLMASFDNFKKQHAAYETAFSKVKALRDEACASIAEAKAGVLLDCERDYRRALDSFLARRAAPSCPVGEVSALAGAPPRRLGFPEASTACAPSPLALVPVASAAILTSPRAQMRIWSRPGPPRLRRPLRPFL